MCSQTWKNISEFWSFEALVWNSCLDAAVKLRSTKAWKTFLKSSSLENITNLHNQIHKLSCSSAWCLYSSKFDNVWLLTKASKATLTHLKNKSSNWERLLIDCNEFTAFIFTLKFWQDSIVLIKASWRGFINSSFRRLVKTEFWRTSPAA